MEKLESEIFENKKPNVLIMRHLDDVDDLIKYGRDGVLESGQEETINSFAREILNEIHTDNKSAVIFVCSSRVRSLQTGDLIVEKIKSINNSIKCKVVSENKLNNIDQGKFILPNNYKQGDVFVGLDLANKIFTEESLSNGNYLYHFGDPVLQKDGSYKYSELLPFFESYGENYKDFLLRIYKMIIETSKKLDKFELNTKVVVITHAQLYQILRDMSDVARMIKDKEINIQAGELPKICWELYQDRFQKGKPFYKLNHVSIEALYDTEILSLLEKEIQYLENII